MARCCPGSVRVEIVGQCWGRPDASEATLLAVPGRQRVLLRQVYLLCEERPWVFARSVIPMATLSGKARRLLHLGARPLGELLFADPAVSRGKVEVASVLRGHRLYARAISRLQRAPDALWARRSLFYLAGRPLLVTEVFLPQCVCVQAQPAGVKAGVTRCPGGGPRTASS